MRFKQNEMRLGVYGDKGVERVVVAGAERSLNGECPRQMFGFE